MKDTDMVWHHGGCLNVRDTHFKHLQREVEESWQWGVEVGLARGGANAVRRRQQQQEGDAVSQLDHFLAVEAEVAGLQTQTRTWHKHMHQHAQIQRQAYRHGCVCGCVCERDGERARERARPVPDVGGGASGASWSLIVVHGTVKGRGSLSEAPPPPSSRWSLYRMWLTASGSSPTLPWHTHTRVQLSLKPHPAATGRWHRYLDTLALSRMRLWQRIFGVCWETRTLIWSTELLSFR